MVKIDSLEKKLAAVETTLTEKIKEEATRTKALIEEELNTAFQILEA